MTHLGDRRRTVVAVIAFAVRFLNFSPRDGNRIDAPAVGAYNATVFNKFVVFIFFLFAHGHDAQVVLLLTVVSPVLLAKLDDDRRGLLFRLIFDAGAADVICFVAPAAIHGRLWAVFI